MSREYAEDIMVSYSDLKKIQKAQKYMYRAGVHGYSDGQLANLLGSCSTILGLAFVNSTPVGVAAGIVGLLSILGSGSDKDTIINWMLVGYLEIGDMMDFLDENPRYDRLVIKFPFFEFTQNGNTVRIITGRGVIQKAHTGHGWDIV